MTLSQTSMLVVKPDGVIRGLVNPIRQIIVENGLTVKTEIRKTLEPDTVEKLYEEVADIKDRDYFPELVSHMSSSPVHIFIVEGDAAIRVIRRIIGKREPPSGIRAKWAESIIKNVAHGPHTPERAIYEINLLTRED
jgi:nucleoside-diphosphate kinase